MGSLGLNELVSQSSKLFADHANLGNECVHCEVKCFLPERSEPAPRSATTLTLLLG